MKLRAISLCLALAASACSHSSKPADTAQTAQAAQTVTSREVSYPADTTLKGFIAYPATSEKRPAVLIVHEWWGLNDYVKKRALQLAEMGYVAMAVDMYGDGKNTTHSADAKTFMMSVMSNIEVGKQRFLAAQELVKNDPRVDASKLAAIGYCFGGATVLHMARSGDNELKLVASFHGSLGTQSPMPKDAFNGQIFVANGAADPFVPPEQVAALKQELDAAGAHYEVVDYEGAKHAFTNPDATEAGQREQLPLEYNEAADKASWAHLSELLAKL